MTEKKIEAIIRNVNAMTRIATGIKSSPEQDERARRMLRGEITLDEALAECTAETLRREGLDTSTD